MRGPAGHSEGAAPPLGAVLAGGRGARIGGAKATADLAGRPLISYAVAAVEAAPETTDDPVESFRGVFAALGFQPMIEMSEGGFTCTLENCPYRASVRENPDVICTLHRGLSAGLLSKLDPKAKLVRFEPRDPDRAGCLVGVEGMAGR